MPNTTQSWTYDAAGNRNDSVCDNLNRAASIGGVACTNDILGNRLTKGSTSYAWDDLNRMVGLTNSSFQTSYVYRADGMRASKTGFDGEETRFTRYRYEGQMGIEDFETRDNNQVNGVRSVLTQYGLGARGIDYMKTTTVTGSGVNQQTQAVDSYPVYDAHGNMVAALAKSGTNGYALSNQRSFDAWGNVRIGSTAGNPTGRYCANIGHKQDDESGLVYMRARYYEPTSGRFVSEDPSMQGINWFSYCGCDPVNRIDQSGKFWDVLLSFVLGFATAWAIAYGNTKNTRAANLSGLVNGIGCALITGICNAYTKAASLSIISDKWAVVLKVGTGAAINVAAGWLISMITDDEFSLTDAILSAVSGGCGGGVSGQAGFLDEVVVGLLGNSVPSGLGAFLDYLKS